MEKHTDGVDIFYARDRNAWRLWLSENHSSKKSVWLVYFKSSSGKTRISYDDAVDEAICFGWIDSKPNKLDDERSIQFFAPRNPKSNWSQKNKMRVARMIRENRMTPLGLRIIKEAKKNGAWNSLNEVEKIKIPQYLLAALNKNKKAKGFFMAFPKSSKRNILEWIHNAKLPATRDRRIEETVRLASNDIRANHYRQPKSKA